LSNGSPLATSRQHAHVHSLGEDKPATTSVRSHADVANVSSTQNRNNIKQRDGEMPIAKIHVLEGRYDERRLGSVSKAVQDALISVLKIPSDDFFQIIHELPRNRFLHTSSFLGMKYSDDFIVLEVTFIAGRPKDTRLALLKELNERIVAGAGISPDDLMIQLSEGPGENFSFGQGLAQRAFVSQGTLKMDR
jgi:Tautomerase enzyme